jgi:cyclopropane fatty-acyl-phospholipid synthase-like methyltransferase
LRRRISPLARALGPSMKGVDEEIEGIDPANAALAFLFAVFAVVIPAGLALTVRVPLLFCLFVLAAVASVLWMVSQGGGNEKVKVGLSMANKWTDSTAVLILFIPFTVVVTPFLNWFLWTRFGLAAVAAQYALLYAAYEYAYLSTPAAETSKYVAFSDAALAARWSTRKIPICILYESYCEGKLTFKKDLLETLEQHRDEFVDWRPTFSIIRFLIVQAFPHISTSFKNVMATRREIADHYDRGNDFFRAFMGPSMVYTCGLFHGGREQSLEEAQFNKLNAVCSKLLVQPGDSFLDIGCGWGTLARHAAKHHGATSTGITLSKEGQKWCEAKNALEKLGDKVKIVWGDYRELPSKGVGKFKRIASIEMAEHVGLANFQTYLQIVSELLEEDGTFLMQVSGLRKGSNWQDTMWGLFMSKYIFPGADASTPMNWYVLELEKAGFEVQSAETIGRHYSHTLRYWYHNFVGEMQKGQLAKKYPPFLTNLWEFFLGWSVVAAGYGSVSCFQFVAHKNTYTFPRDAFIKPTPLPPVPFGMPAKKADSFPE